MSARDVAEANQRWLAIFEDRHGPGSFERLMEELGQPCITFAAIAARLGVTRERVRQWQLRLMPDAPRGHERQRLCATYRRKRRLLEDPLFRDFFRHARTHVDRGRIELIAASDGFRTRSVRIDRRIVALQEARLVAGGQREADAPAYVLTRSRGAADFHYYRLTPADYLLLPGRALPPARATFIDRPGSHYEAFKNTFQALAAEAPGSMA